MNVKPNIDDLRSHHLRPAAMPWQKTRFAGCEFKPLMVDPTSGLATLLFRMRAGRGFARPRARADQADLRAGGLASQAKKSRCRHRIGPGESSGDRPEPSAPRWSPKGGTFIAIFQIPNKKFFEQDGRGPFTTPPQGLVAGLGPPVTGLNFRAARRSAA